MQTTRCVKRKIYSERNKRNPPTHRRAPARPRALPDRGPRDLDSLTASRMSCMVAFVLIPGTSKGDFGVLLQVRQNVSPPRLVIRTSSLRAVSSTSDRRCLASEYVKTLMVATPEPGCSTPATEIGGFTSSPLKDGTISCRELQVPLVCLNGI